MRYSVSVGDRTFEVEFTNGNILIDGQPVSAELVPLDDVAAAYHLSLDGVSHLILARRGEDRADWQLLVNGVRVTAQVLDERTKAIRALTSHSTVRHAPRAVRAPMPGMIVRVEVEAGQQVTAGQGVVIIEAMKMENELRAEADGVVSRVHVQSGTAVEKGAVLIEFDTRK